MPSEIAPFDRCARLALCPVFSITSFCTCLLTFEVRHHPFWDLNSSSIVQVARGGLEEEEGLGRNLVVELLCVLDVVAPDGNDLAARGTECGCHDDWLGCLMGNQASKSNVATR